MYLFRDHRKKRTRSCASKESLDPDRRNARERQRATETITKTKTKTKRRRDRKNKSQGRQKSQAQRSRSDWRLTPPPFRQHPNHPLTRARWGRGNTKSDGENRARGFSLRAALVTGCKGERVGIGWLDRMVDRTVRDELYGVDGAPLRSRGALSRCFLSPPPSLQRGYFPRLPEGCWLGAHARGPRFRLAS